MLIFLQFNGLTLKLLMKLTFNQWINN